MSLERHRLPRTQARHLLLVAYSINMDDDHYSAIYESAECIAEAYQPVFDKFRDSVNLELSLMMGGPL